MAFIDPSRDYIPLFHFNGLGNFDNSIWINGYIDLEAMVTSVKEDCRYWLPKASIDRALDQGVELFSNQVVFEKYRKGFERLINTLAGEFLTRIKSPKEISRSDLEYFAKEIALSFEFFSKTEWFFVDKAFVLSAGNEVMKKNLVTNYELKEHARIKLINDVFYGEEAYLNFIRKKIAGQFGQKSEDIFNYSLKEVFSLYDGKVPPKEDIEERKIAWVLFASKGIAHSHYGEAVRLEINAIVKEKVDSALPKGNTLKGIIANKGKVTGRVKIIISNPKTFDYVNKEINVMKQGDILVAETTSPEFMPACRKAGAILANQGGLLSHAAVVSREFGIPCIVGLKVATKFFKDGDMVEVDANTGIVRKLN